MRTDLSKPYNWTDRRPDGTSEDYRNVIAWLTAHGAPTPTLIQIPLDQTGWAGIFGAGAFPGTIPMLAFPGDPLPHDAALVLNSPGVILKELGITRDDIEYHPPSLTLPTPAPVTTHIGQPLGRGFYAQVEPETDPAKDGDIVTGLDGKQYKFVKGMIGGWYEAVK